MQGCLWASFWSDQGLQGPLSSFPPSPSHLPHYEDVTSLNASPGRILGWKQDSKVERLKEVINVPTKGCLWGWQWWAALGCVWSLQKLPDTGQDTGRSEAGYSEYSFRFIIYKVLSQPWKCWDSQKSCRNVLIKEHNGNVNWEGSPGESSPGGS